MYADLGGSRAWNARLACTASYPFPAPMIQYGAATSPSYVDISPLRMKPNQLPRFHGRKTLRHRLSSFFSFASRTCSSALIHSFWASTIPHRNAVSKLCSLKRSIACLQSSAVFSFETPPALTRMLHLSYCCFISNTCNFDIPPVLGDKTKSSAQSNGERFSESTALGFAPRHSRSVNRGGGATCTA